METKELHYAAPPLHKTFLAKFFDYFLVLILGGTLFGISQWILPSIPVYSEAKNNQTILRLQSRLYVAENEELESFSSYVNKQDWTRKEKAEYYEEELTYFFTSFLGDSTRYVKDKSSAKANGENLFLVDGSWAFSASDYEPSYLAFYENEYQNVALGLLHEFPDYRNSSRAILLTEIVDALVCFSFSHILLLLVIPFCFRRGKKTLGLFFAHIGRVGKDGLSISAGRHLLLWLFDFAFLFLGSIAAFLIPLGISIGMTLLRQDHQSLGEYVIGVHLVDDSEQRIFVNSFEIIESHQK
ncbi:MAG: hypothetical protein SOV58_01765 [Candidatus Enteromonas sp.]|nr:hypothetical protein [Candidatus Enteromonas sp.]